MDVVYVVRPGERNEELRYSLRTIAANFPHDRVFIVGHTPQWATGVESIQTVQAGTKYANSTRNVLTACLTEDISDPFVLMNDDFFIVEPIVDIPTLHRGPIADVLTQYQRRAPGSKYVAGMADTLALLRSLGHVNPLSYELHIPLVVTKGAMRDAIKVATTAGLEVPHKRSIYGNLAGIGGTQMDDVKVLTNATVRFPGPFISTKDDVFNSGWIGRRINADYQKPGPYEAT